MKKPLLLALLTLAGARVGVAQNPQLSSMPGITTVCYASPTNSHTRIAPPAEFLRQRAMAGRATAGAKFEVKYTGFTPEAKAAFQYAVDIWSTLVKSDVVIRIDATWKPLGSRVLGSAGATGFRKNMSGAPQNDVWYPIALAEKIAGRELNASTSPDIVASFSSTTDWYLGTDGFTPANKTDLVSVVLHELGHGLGFFDAMDWNERVGSHGYSELPIAFDSYIENSTNRRLVDATQFPNPSTALGSQLVSNRLFFGGNLARAVNNGARPKLYAPSTFEPGSSIAHLDESTYLAGDVNSLMTPQIGAAEAIHKPGPITLKMFDEMGWFNTAIRHTPLRDTETPQDFVIKATIQSDGTVKAGSTSLIYAIDGGTETTVELKATGTANEYAATIPNPGAGRTVQYYLTASDNETNRVYTAPGQPAPGVAKRARFSFKVGADVTAPQVAHTPPSFLFTSQLPYTLTVYAADNVGVGQVTVEYSINGVAQTPLTLTKTADNTYTGTLGSNGNIKAGDVITYRVVVVDVAKAQNKAFNPESGVYTINVVNIKPTQVTYINQLNSTTPLDFVGNGFSIIKPEGFSSSAIHSLHPYPDGADENNESNYIYQLLVPIQVRESRAEATVKFDEIVLVEPGDAGSTFGSANFYDYVVVEGSKDGQTWIPLAPGYDARDNGAWLDAYESSKDSKGNSLAQGTPSLFKTRELNLRDKFNGGDVVQLRFRLFADEAAHGWGWAIDNVRIQDNVTGVAQEIKNAGGLSVYPNPSTGRFLVQANLPKATPGLELVVRNVLGQEILRRAVRQTPGQLQETLDLGHLSNGLYLVSLGTGADVLTQRVMVQK